MAQETELTKEVPTLLEVMNRTSSEVNSFEGQVGESQERYRKLLEQWSRLYEDLRAQHGSAIDRVKPYFDAAQVFNASSQKVQTVVREFSAAASQHSQAKAELRSIETCLAYGAHKVRLDCDQQDGLSKATVRVLRCQQERDRREQEYSRALAEYQDAQKGLESWKNMIGEFTIKRTLPCFRQLQQQQNALATEQQRINSFTDKAQAAKASYNHAIKELDRISGAVHDARKVHKAMNAAAELNEAQRAPEQSPEAAPEVAVEVPGDDCDCSAKVFAYDGIPVAAPTPRRVRAEPDCDDGPFS